MINKEERNHSTKPTTLLVDLYKIKNTNSGLGQFSLQFSTALLKHQPKDVLIDFLIPNNKHLQFNGNVNLIKSSVLNKATPIPFKKYTIWHSLHQFPSHKPPSQSIWILTIHDLNFLIEKSEKKRKKYLNRLQKNIDKADCITTISTFSKQQIEQHLNVGTKTVRVIYNGVTVSNSKGFTKPNFSKNSNFFFSIGIFNPKKNFHSLISMMKLFPNYHLVLAGDNNTPYGKEIQKEIERLNLTDRIILPGMINDNDKSWLFKNCDAFLFPSLAEGFGMPVIEAMKYGKPVFLSTFSSLPEIGGTTAFYFESFDEKEMAHLIRTNLKIISENTATFSEESKNYAKKFNWEKSIEKYIDLYSELTDSY